MRSLTLALVGVLVLALKRAFELVLEKEYATWAPAFARLLVTAAGFVYWPRREQWRADLRYMQQVEDGSGLLPAGWCLLSAPWLVVRHVVGVLGVTCRQLWVEHVSLPGGLLVAGVMSSLIVGVGAGLVAQDRPTQANFAYGVAFSPDGKTIAIGSGGGTVRLWTSSTGKAMRQPLTRRTSAVVGVAFGPDGKTIASASIDGTVRLWDVSTGQPIGQALTGTMGPVFVVSFSPDGKMIASAGDDTVQLWDLVTGKPIGQALAGHTAPVYGVSFSPDGKTIASASVPRLKSAEDILRGNRGSLLRSSSTRTAWGRRSRP
jgi:hypothetical protein